MVPEEGRSAIAAASRAIADLRLGRIDEQTTANVGLITGGTARNIVPEWCSFEAEARSHDERALADLVQEMLDAMGFAASLGDCTLETDDRRHLRRLSPARATILSWSSRRGALERCGFEVTTARTGGGADANVFNQRGIPCVEPRERDGRDPHRRRAHRGRRPRRDGRRDAALCVDAARA